MPRLPVAALLLLGISAMSGSLDAQEKRYEVLPFGGKKPVRAVEPSETADSTRTTVTVELLTGRLGGGLNAQEWAKIFREIDFPGRIRQGRVTDRLGVSETTRGRLRDIRVVGRLDPDGSVRFADRRIKPSDAARLKEWLVELQTFGEQGAPTGQPIWGLNRAQFDAVHRTLATPTSTELVGLPFVTMMSKIATPKTLPLRISEDARTSLARVPETAQVRTGTKGFTLGTSLAIVFREQGFGMRPTRTPSGEIELTLDPLSKTTDVWPIGWEFEGSRQKAIPKMFSFVPVRLEDSALPGVLDVISARTEVPIVVDHYGIRAAGIDFDELRVTYPSKKTTWSLLLRNVLGPHKLIREFRTDEAGRVFCWVTVFRPRPLEDD